MNSAASFATPPEEEGPCGDWTYHEWAEAFSTNDLARSLPPGHIAVVGQRVKQGTIHIDLHRLALVCAGNG